jgi:hypothetical protein
LIGCRCDWRGAGMPPTPRIRPTAGAPGC